MKKITAFFKKIEVVKIAALIGGALLAVLLISAFDALASWGKVHPGVTAGGVDVGGMSKRDAEKALRKDFERSLYRPVLLTHKGKSWKLKPKDLKFKVDYKRTVDEAYSIGREDGIVGSIDDRAAAWFGGEKVKVFFSVDETAVSASLDAVEGEIGEKARDAAVVFDGITPSVVKAKSGYKIDRIKAVSDIKRALADRIDRKVSLRLVPAEPDITDRQAEKAAQRAAGIVAEPLVLAYKELKWVLQPADLAALIVFAKEKKGAGYSYDPVLDKAKFTAKVEELTSGLTVEPKDAEFRIVGDSVSVVPGENGRKINADEAYEQARKALQNGDRKIYMSMIEVEPQLTTEKAKSYGIEKKLASYTTYYSPSATARVNNIHLIADAIDGAIVAPGEVFSVNERVGPRTADKGYKEAPVIINGRLEPGIGGGICQAVTTLFDAVFFAGLDIVERSNHAFYISRYPAGLDATVSYGSLDLKFRNDTGYHILIKFWYTSDSVTAAIYGKDGLGIEVDYSTTPFTNYRGFQTTIIEDPQLPKGTRIVEQDGVMGRDITAFRTVKRNGKVVHRDTFFSRYDPEPAIVRVGTKEIPQPASTSTNTASGQQQ